MSVFTSMVIAPSSHDMYTDKKKANDGAAKVHGGGGQY